MTSATPQEEPARRLTVFDIWGPGRHRARPGVAALAIEGVRLAWRAGPGDLATIAVVQTLSVAGVALEVLLGRALLASVLQADRAGAGSSSLLGRVLVLAGVTAVLGVAGAIAANRQRLLAERCARSGEHAVIAVTAAAALGAFDDPGFHDRVARARVAVQRLPALISGLVALGRALAAGLGAALALVAVTPLFAPVLVLIAVPAWLAARLRSRAFYQLAAGFTPADRERQYLAQLLMDRPAAKEVRAFTLGPYLRRRHDDLWEERMGRLADVARRQLAIAVGADLAGSALMAAALLGLVALTLDHGLSLAAAGASAVALLLLGQRLALAGASAGGISESALFLRDYVDLVGRPAAGAQPPESRLPAPPSLRVVAERISFTYPGGSTPALVDVSLEIAPGEVVALVGENGSGKTTLATLLAGLQPPDRGQVSWNGVALDAGALEARRGWVAVIFQDFLRYALPAWENIGLGAPSRIGDRAGIERAGAIAGTDDLLRGLPLGYESLLGPEFLDGVDLSVGQWQRIALARALFADAPFVILDEPSAALDAQSEHTLFESIRRLLGGRSVLLISHRLSSVRLADRIIVLEAGRIAEAGSHKELMTADGRYARMFALQAAPYR